MNTENPMVVIDLDNYLSKKRHISFGADLLSFIGNIKRAGHSVTILTELPESKITPVHNGEELLSLVDSYQQTKELDHKKAYLHEFRTQQVCFVSNDFEMYIYADNDPKIIAFSCDQMGGYCPDPQKAPKNFEELEKAIKKL